MAAEDVPLALQRHATSKITLAEDLARIRHWDFAARLCQHRRRQPFQPGYEAGWHLGDGNCVHGGKTVSLEAAGCPDGTAVKVGTFFIIHRLKFMKSAAAETARIRVAVEKLALAWPGISTLAVNGRTVFTTPGSSNQGCRAAGSGPAKYAAASTFFYTGTLRLSVFLPNHH